MCFLLLCRGTQRAARRCIVVLQKALGALAEAKSGRGCRESSVCVRFACFSPALAFSSVMFMQDPLFTGCLSELRGMRDRESKRDIQGGGREGGRNNERHKEEIVRS